MPRCRATNTPGLYTGKAVQRMTDSNPPAFDNAHKLSDELRDLEWRLYNEGFASIADHAITKEQFLEAAKMLAAGDEQMHQAMDFLLLLLIADRDVAKAYDATPKWYA